MNLAKMTTEDLLELYSQLCMQQNTAEKRGDIAKFNRLFGRIGDIHQELKRRPGDQRSLLLNLFNHPDMQVRLNAAKGVLDVAPLEARKQIRVIADSGWFPQAGDAGMYLDIIDGKYGRFPP